MPRHFWPQDDHLRQQTILGESYGRVPRQKSVKSVGRANRQGAASTKCFD